MRLGVNSLPQITKELTLPKLLLQICEQMGANRVAMREKEYGIWRPVTWSKYLEYVRHICLGMVSLGLQREDKVAMIGDNRPQGLWTEMAALCAGGVAVWLYQDCLIDEVEYIIDHADAKFMFAEGQEEVDKGLSVRGRCPKLKKIIWDDPKGMRGYDDPMLVSLKEVHRLGRKLDQHQPRLFEQLLEQGNGDDICLLFYTSGTTARPKGALLSHYNMLKMGQNLMRVDPCYPEDDFVSYLPFAWIGEQMMSISCGLQIGFTINFPEEPETAQDDIRQIGPQTMFAPPRIYEQMVRTIQVKHLDASWLKRKIYDWCMKVGYARADCIFEKKPLSFGLRLRSLLAHCFVFKKLKDYLGLSRIRQAYTGGAAMGPDHFRFFHAIGVNLKQIYGQTEISGISVLHRDGDVKFDTVGNPLPETEVKVTEKNEIISHSPSVFKGYYKDPEATATALRDGWLYSEDSGFFDEEGHLVVFERSKDVMILNDGRQFSPQFLEARLKFSPYLKDVWVIGHNRPYLSAVICIDYATVGKWAEQRGIPYTSYPELSQKPDVYELVKEPIIEVNRTLPEAASIRKFVNLYKEFDPDDEELTRTRKIRRAFVEKRYSPIVKALYSDDRSVQMNTTITYEDGRVAEIRTTMSIDEVPQKGEN
jgi:long-chain acyl-CoA synthetase